MTTLTSKAASHLEKAISVCSDLLGKSKPLSGQTIKMLARGFPNPEEVEENLLQAKTEPFDEKQCKINIREEVCCQLELEPVSTLVDLEAEQIRLIDIHIKSLTAQSYVRIWLEQGIMAEMDYDHPGKIKDVRLSFTPIEWYGLLNKEGDFLPVCCANISQIRDYLFDAMREDCFISTEKLQQIIHLLDSHGLDCGELEEEHPLRSLITLWAIIKDHVCGVRKPMSLNPNDVEDAIGILASSVRYLNYRDFGIEKEPKKEHYSRNIFWEQAKIRRKDDLFSQKVQTSMAVSRLLPAMKTLLNEAAKLYGGPISAYAIITDSGKVADTVGGIAVWETSERCQEILKRWEEDEIKADKQIDDDLQKEFTKAEEDQDQEFIEKRLRFRQRYSVKPVLISLEKGLQIL